MTMENITPKKTKSYKDFWEKNSRIEWNWEILPVPPPPPGSQKEYQVSETFLVQRRYRSTGDVQQLFTCTQDDLNELLEVLKVRTIKLGRIQEAYIPSRSQTNSLGAETIIKSSDNPFIV